MSQRLLARALVAAALAVAACATIVDVPVPALRAQHALGVRRLLVLGVSFPGIEPGRTPAQLREHVLERSAEYYAAQSWGKTTPVGEVTGWYRLPRPLEDYTVSPHNVEVDRRRVRLLGVRNVLVGSRSLILSQMRDRILRRSVVKPVAPTDSQGISQAAQRGPDARRRGMRRARRTRFTLR